MLLLLITVSAAASVTATDSITGVVRDAKTKQPVNAVRISVINKNKMVVTDENGAFTIAVTSPKDVLLVEAYDYNVVEVPVRGKAHLTIDLYSDVFGDYFKNVNGIGGVNSNSRQINSVKTVSNFSDNQALAADEILQGVLGGDVRSVSRSGISGMGSSLFIRGINSLNANAQPLFVVDGVLWNNLYDITSVHEGFFSNTLEYIDINDIETISVIKDGASIYGSKAANGVILIRTKRGKDPVTKISLNVMQGFVTEPSSVPMMDGEAYRLYAADMFGSAGVSGAGVAELGFTQTDPSNAVYNTYHNNTDWNDEVYQTGRNSHYMIDVTGGDDKAMYYFSLGYADNESVIKETGMNRLNIRLNADLYLTREFDLGLNVGFSRIERDLQDDGVNSYSSPTWLAKIKSPFLSPFLFTSTGEITPDYDDTDEFGIGNPMLVLSNSLNSLKKYRFNIGLAPVYRISPVLTVSSQFDYSLHKTIERRFVPMDGTATRYLDGYGYVENEINSQVMRNTAVFDETRLTYEKRLDKLNHIKALYGFRYLNNYYESDYAVEYNTGSDNNTTITGDYDYLQVDGINDQTRSLSNFLQADYDFDNRYFVSAAVSVDGSSRFGTETESGFSLFGHSYGVFPSINAGWIVSSETFMKSLDFIDFCKLRAGYGITGNDGIQDYENMTYFSIVRFMSEANGLIIGNIANEQLQWETTGKVNLGLDMGLFNEVATVSFDVFSSQTNDLLTLRDAPLISGLGQYWCNGGTMTNKGYELSADAKVLNLNHLKWEVGINVGHYKNEVTALPDGSYTTSVYDGEVLTAVGESAGSFYGYKTNGVFSTDAEAAAAYTDPATGTSTYLLMETEDGEYEKFSAGDMQFEEVVVDGIIDEKDKQVIGDPNPDFYGTISSRIFVDRLSLSTIFTYSIGNDIYNYSRSQLEAGEDFSNQTSAMENRWTGEGQTTTIPRAVYGDPMGNARFSDRWIEDGSYLRLKTVALSYDIPLKSTYIHGFTVWVSANNLMTLTNYLGLDPEVSAGNSVYYQGIDAGLVPATRSYAFGFKFNL